MRPRLTRALALKSLAPLRGEGTLGGSAVICFGAEPPEGKRPTWSLPPYPVAVVVETLNRAGFSEVRSEMARFRS
jgi:hypothetical protein